MIERWRIWSDALLILGLCMSSGVEAAAPKVDSVTPSCGSLNGGTRITIYGSNFARNFFNFGDGNEDLGSRVQLASINSFDCEIHPDGSHETQIMCYTLPMPSGEYDVRVSVDGKSVASDRYCDEESDCKFTVSSDDCTPTINSVSPVSGMPGEFLEISGDIITTKYGSNEPDEFENIILRVYYGGQKCELRNLDNDTLYGITLDDGNGWMRCLTEGTYIGNIEISYLISNEYGRSQPAPRTKHVRRTGPSMYQAFTEISEISQSTGSTVGGTRLTITGQHFDETVSPVKVFIGGQECEVEEPITDTTIVCSTPADASTGVNDFTGGRGLYCYWTSGITNASSVDVNTADVEHIDASAWDGTSSGDYARIMRGYFIPPFSGDFTFSVTTDGSAAIYLSSDSDPANKIDITSSSSSIALVADNTYYVEVHHGSSDDEKHVTLKARLAQTYYAEEDTGMAEHEIQDMVFTSTITKDIHVIDVETSGSASVSQADVQTITIRGDPTAFFSIGLDNIYTAPLQMGALSSGSDVSGELKKLPNIDFGVSVELRQTDDDMALVITSDSSLGEISDYTGKVVGGARNALTFSSERTTLGKDKLDTFTIKMDGIPSPPISVGASASEVASALETLFGVQCHPKLSEGKVFDFEEDDDWISGRVSDEEPFCGRYSTKNPRFIFHKGFGETDVGVRVSTTTSRFMCLAYKGLGKVSLVRIRYIYYDLDNEEQSGAVFFRVNNDNSERWSYWCEDIYALIDAAITGSGIVVEYAQAFREDSDEDLFIDQVVFNREKPLDDALIDGVLNMRGRQVQPNDYFIDTFTVTATSASQYEIELSPHHCGYNLPMFKVAGATKSGSTYTISNGGSVSVTVTRSQTASPPIDGSFRVTFKGDTSRSPIPVTVEIDDDNIVANLATMSVGFSEVTGSGTCSAFTYRIKMVSTTGDQPLMEIDSSRLTGTEVQATVTTIQNGGLWFDPIMGDLLRTYHTTPQVIAFINNIPTRCSNPTACTFEWSSSVTPAVSSISPTSGSHGDSVSITGTGFDGSISSNNEVIIGTTPCTVTSATTTNIACTINNGPTGEADVKVYVAAKGLADTNVKFTYVTGVDTFSPSPGSVEGGSLLTIDGFGYTNDANVTLDGRTCSIVEISESQITCKTPRAASESASQTVDVVITQHGSTSVAGQFTYNPSLTYTPVISAISATTSNVWGGDSLTIDGQGFGSVEMPVTLGGVQLDTTSYTDTQIIVILPALSQGSYKILVDVDNKGYADLRKNSISDITYTLQVSSMTPTFGSLYGGTNILITGEGFGSNTSVLDVTIGSHVCGIETLSSTEIKCRIADTGVHHTISATGTHKNYGIGYAWDKDPHTVNVGDYVTWTWSTPFYVSDIVYGVHQTATASDVMNMDGGFSSGANSRTGSFTHHFTKEGTYFYWTGYMDLYDIIYFRGTIVVTSLESHSGVLTVQLYSSEAAYDIAGSQVTATTSCASASSQLPGCTDSTSLSSDSAKFNFQFLKCYSPYIESISRSNGTTNDIITFTGDGFGNTECQNEILFDGSACNTVTSSIDSVDFQISSIDAPPIGVLLGFTMRVANLGYALTTITDERDLLFGLLPRVEGITPFDGSKVGGTKVTITGSGFEGGVDNIYVDMTYMSCIVESADYTSIVCETVCGSNPNNCFVGRMTTTVRVGSVLAECVSPACNFISDEMKTATVTAMSPNTVSSASTAITVSGAGFGTKAGDLVVTIGGEECVVSGAVTDTSFTCTVGRLPVGDNRVDVYVANDGKAATTVTILSQKDATISSPSASSTYGGAVMTLSGNGFVNGDTNVTVGGIDCPIVSTAFDQITCTLPAQTNETYDVIVTSNGIDYDTVSLTYSSAATPDVTSITPTGGQSGDSVTIGGSGFKPASINPTVTIGGVECTVATATATSITCNVGTQQTGSYDILVFVPETGKSNEDVKFTYELGAFTINPSTGSNNGGQAVTLTGSGFLENNTAVTVCGDPCGKVSVSASEYVCTTPSTSDPSSPVTCDVVVTVDGVTQTQASAYAYDPSLVSTISSVSPSRGGTGGGTLITITGTNFGSNTADVSVSIADVACSVQTASNTQITCRIGAARSADADVSVQRNGWGEAVQTNAAFEYIDLWSSPYTWGGASPPVEGDFVIIPAGQKILLDNSTAILKMLLIQGGEMIFDEKDVELQAENILITDGGLLQIGTADNPFPRDKKAIITMHGNLRSKELPIYGTKTLAVREGTLNLYGAPVTHTWTRLSSTAAAGSTTLQLEQSVDWQVGDEIIIATTGHRHSQKESEVHVISTISGGTTLTLESPLAYEHLGISGTFGSTTVDFRAEVGLLTRNVVVRGNRNTAFDTQIEACPAGFNTGEFATQTCFQGRFGEELGSDQFGAQIMIHQEVKDTQVAQAHLQYVELTHSGQAFRMGRYPIHFHLNGDMDQSFVRGCSIHTSFNRAVNVHGSHNVMVEHNVIYNVMGGAFFLEDGDETGNSFQYNLAVFVRSSTSLRNDDITPAAFWATNPNNTISHNTAAGGTHFGTWYRMHTHPEGPGFDPNICPQAVPLGEYRNNTAHSLGWFGLWIFETYVPRVGASCSSSADHQVAQFYSLTAWNCEKGAEGVNSGALQFREFVLVNNEKAGYEGKLLVNNPPQFDSANGPGVFDSVIVAHYDSNLSGSATSGGIVIPYHPGFLIENVQFYNFDQSGTSTIRWARIDGTCNLHCGGFHTETSGLQFIFSPNKVAYGWESEGVLYDRDGSLTGNTGYSVAAWTDSFDPTECTQAVAMSVGIPGCICTDQIKLIRFSFNNILPSSLDYKDAIFATEFGSSNSPWAKKRITHKKGWSMVLMANNYYNFSFENAGHITNISYDSAFYNFGQSGDFVVFTQYADQKPDLFMLDGSTPLNMSDTMLSGNSVSYGEWFYSVPDTSITYAISQVSRKKRSVYLSSRDFSISTRAIRCFYRGCQPPKPPMEITEEPTHKEKWSDAATWVNFTADGLEPSAMDDLYIPKDKWIIVDTAIPPLGTVTIEGGLQFQTNSSMNILLEADYIYITGRLIMGWSDTDPYEGQAVIRLRGSHSSSVYPVSDGPALGSKFIAVFGGLQLHGVHRGIIKTHLATTVNPGSNSITVRDSVTWTVGDDILISTTDYNAWHTEVFKISAISGSTITLNNTIKYRHIAHSEVVNGNIVDLSASVALLTRNIRIEGEEYVKMEKESFGARVIVGQTFDSNGQHSGFAQVSNVEFYHTGQEGFSENYDARFSLTYSDVTTSAERLRYSYVKKSTFHSGFNTAVGVFGVDDLEIDDNTVYHTVGAGLRTESSGTKITNNLVTLSIWPGAYQNRQEPLNVEYDGAIHAPLATQLILANNTIAGSERVGYRVPGQACSTASSDLWSNNMAQGCMEGVLIFSADNPADSSCTLYNGFTAWKNFDFGIYYQSSANGEIKNNILVENGVGIFPFVFGPGAISHQYAEKTMTIENNMLIGKTSSFSESEDVIDSSDDNIILSSDARGAGTSVACGKIGIMMGTFSSAGNNAPEKPFAGILTYQSILGLTRLAGNTFVTYGACTGGRDYAIATNPKNDDGIHPLQMSSTTSVNVDSTAKIKFHNPNVRKINSADCVDMDCDGLKKCMIRDLDGTFLGAPGTVLPNSAYEWDGDRRHGLGDYRIPLVMLTTSSGDKIDVNSYAPNKGIYKTDNCTWITEWNAFSCGDNHDWRMLSIESMDSDTETRRLSPVAVYHPEGYVDLINGPQDHGWCSGYTCRKRLSTFQAIVALDEPFDIFLASTNPKVMRYMLLNSNANECVRLGMWYMTTNRLEVSVDDNVLLPKNGFLDSAGGFRLRLQDTNNQYMPDVNDNINGEYFLSRAEQMIFWIQCGGSSVITVTQKDVFIVSFTLPAMTESELFGERIVENLAAFLDMDPNKVRIVDIVEDTSNTGRKKRSVDTTTFYVEIADTPGEADTVDYATVGQTICNQAQLYTMDTVINATVLYTAVLEPDSNSSSSGQMVTLQQTGQLVLDPHPVGDCQEGHLFTVQPKFKVTDFNGDVVSYLGSVTSAWEIEASIKSGSPRARLLGDIRTNFTDGWANFTDLAISNKGSYILEFQVVSPPEATNYSIESLAVTINGRNLAPRANIKTTDRLTGFPIELEVNLMDEDSNTDITDIEWANHTWTAAAAIYDSKIYQGTLGGTTATTFDPSTGKATFYNLQLSKSGKCPLLVTITSDPSDYEVKMVVMVDTLTSAQKNMIIAEQHTLEIKFPLTYDEERAPYWTAQFRNIYSDSSELRITGDGHRSGSFVVSLNIEATISGYNDTLNTLCYDIENSTTFTFDNTTVAMSGYLTVDGATYYGVSCGSISTDNDDDDDDELETVYIAVIAVLAVMVLVLAGVLIAYKLYFHPHAKTNDAESAHYKKQYARQDLLPDALTKEGTFTSLKSSRPTSPPVPPIGTSMPTGNSFDLSITSPQPSSRAPTVRKITPEPPKDISSEQPKFAQPSWNF